MKNFFVMRLLEPINDDITWLKFNLVESLQFIYIYFALGYPDDCIGYVLVVQFRRLLG